MIQAGSYVRVGRKDSLLHGSVFQVLEVRQGSFLPEYLVINERKRGDEYNCAHRLDDSDHLEEVDYTMEGPFCTPDLLSQPIYGRASDHFQKGDLVRVTMPTGESFKARVYNAEIGDWDFEPSLVSLICVGNARPGQITRARWDWLNLDKRMGEEKDDYMTGEPIQYESLALPLYGRNNLQLGWVSSDTAIRYNCFEVCNCCGRLFFASSMDTVNGVWICHRCVSAHYTECDQCGRYVRTEEAYVTEHNDVLCSECAREHGYDRREQDCVIHRYGYKPAPIFHGTERFGDPSMLFMGVELEVDGADQKQECAEELLEIENNRTDLFYLKEDASLTHGGFEIVTHPCTLEYHQQSFPWKRIIDIAQSYHFLSHNIGTCGLHVHVNRTALGDTADERDDTAAKIIMIFDRFWDMFVRFSRRRRGSLDHYAFAPNAQIQPGDTRFKAIYKSKDACTDHYCAVNLSNQNTVEFRIFRGTLKYNTLIASLQLVSNVVEIAKTHTLEEISTMTWESIINIHRYDELVQYLTERNMPGADE